MSRIPTTHKEWRLRGRKGIESLKFNEHAPVPQLGDTDVLVKFHAATLNYRDAFIARGLFPMATKDNMVPGSDGAGEVVAVGHRVTRFQSGARVTTIFNQGHIAGPLNNENAGTTLGTVIDGTLRQYGVFNQECLVHVPRNLDWLEASTLSCAAVTAWNCFYGLEGHILKSGETVLTQGTGGVSVFALQFAKAAGARVIATTSSEAKATKLKQLGADHVINYKETLDWGEKAKELTGGRGVDHVVEVGGNHTMAQCLKCVRIDGVITLVGAVGNGSPETKQPSFLDVLLRLCTIRAVMVGSRQQFEEMNRAIEANDIHPVIDEKTFALEQLKDAYEHLWERKHFGKVVVRID